MGKRANCGRMLSARFALLIRAFSKIVSTGISLVSHPFRSKNAEWMGHPRSIAKAKML
jgi:hypothetical protein